MRLRKSKNIDRKNMPMLSHVITCYHMLPHKHITLGGVSCRLVAAAEKVLTIGWTTCTKNSGRKRFLPLVGRHVQRTAVEKGSYLWLDDMYKEQR